MNIGISLKLTRQGKSGPVILLVPNNISANVQSGPQILYSWTDRPPIPDHIQVDLYNIGTATVEDSQNVAAGTQGGTFGTVGTGQSYELHITNIGNGTTYITSNTATYGPLNT